jgi:hypothetical protein
MKFMICLVCFLVGSSSIACAAEQSLSVKLAVGSWLSDDELTFGETGYAYNHGGMTLEGVIQYRTYEHVLIPFVSVVYRFDEMPGGSKNDSMGQLIVTNLLAEAGVGTTFEAGHSKMDLGIGLGYCMRDLEADGGAVDLLSLDKDDVAFSGLFAIHFPFFDHVDATLLYRIVYSAGGTESGNYGPTEYAFELADIHHLFSFGLSYYP